MNELVSIIIPTYKRPKAFIKRAIDSVLQQTYANVEVVLIDDNAGEALKPHRQVVLDLLKEYSNEKRITYLQNSKNIGASLSRNKGIQNAKGSYISFLDDDDLYLPEKVEAQLTYMLDNHLEMCFSNLKYRNEKEEVVDVRVHTKLKSMSKEDLLTYHLTRHITGTPTFMYKKEILLEIGGFPPQDIAEEYHLMLKTIEGNYKMGYLPRIDIIAYRHSNGGLSSGSEKIKGENELYQFKKTYFNRLKFRDRLFIRFRHSVILGISHKRNKHFVRCMAYLIRAVLISPADAFIEVTSTLKNINKCS